MVLTYMDRQHTIHAKGEYEVPYALAMNFLNNKLLVLFKK